LYKNKREHFNQIFKVNKEFFSSSVNDRGANFKENFNIQKQQFFQRTVAQKDPMRSIGSSFFNLLKFFAALLLIPTWIYLSFGEINGTFFIFLVFFILLLYFSFFNSKFRASFIGRLLRFLINGFTILALFGIINSLLSYADTDDFDYERDDDNETEYVELRKIHYNSPISYLLINTNGLILRGIGMKKNLLPV
jgi:hypothetical protein